MGVMVKNKVARFFMDHGVVSYIIFLVFFWDILDWINNSPSRVGCGSQVGGCASLVYFLRQHVLSVVFSSLDVTDVLS